jgi:hypothetical protein
MMAKPPKSPAGRSLDIFGEEDKIRRSGVLVEDFDDAEMEKLQADEFFQYIPREITATRLPGTNERYPILALLGLLVFVIANVGAVLFFIQQMIAT